MSNEIICPSIAPITITTTLNNIYVFIYGASVISSNATIQPDIAQNQIWKMTNITEKRHLTRQSNTVNLLPLQSMTVTLLRRVVVTK